MFCNDNNVDVNYVVILDLDYYWPCRWEWQGTDGNEDIQPHRRSYRTRTGIWQTSTVCQASRVSDRDFWWGSPRVVGNLSKIESVASLQDSWTWREWVRSPIAFSSTALQLRHVCRAESTKQYSDILEEIQLKKRKNNGMNLYCWNFLIWQEVPVNVHSKIHHVGFAEQIEFRSQQLIFFVDLQQTTK